MKRWEYKIVDVASSLGLYPSVEGAVAFAYEVLNRFGDEGWELVSVRGCLAFLKGPIEV